ncbi:MAG: hypothetical protein JWQ95_2445 [Sphaerisporangium sp.]|nr:hypothetical protein [Sphaerisporangium sp.]
MSSGTPESPDQNPRDWQSPYGTSDAYGGRPPSGDSHGNPAQPTPYQDQQPPYDQPPYSGQPYDQAYGPPAQPPYDQPYGPPAQPPYDQAYGPPTQGPYDQAYGPPAQGPYGQPGYGQPYGYSPYQQNAYGYPPRPANDGTRTHAIVALVISLVLAMSCYVTLGGIAGAILSGIALGKAETEPHQARKLLMWCWISIGINIALLVLGVAGIFVVGFSG